MNKILHSLQKGKIPGLDGFTLDFFLGFYDLLKTDILKVVRESQRTGKVLGAMNATFITLIPKKQRGETFEDFRPISYCNMMYKIIYKIISQRLKPIMSQFITEEQFGFLFNRQIHDATSLEQEALHSIKKETQSSFALKIDMSKSYDKVSWTFIHLMLI